MAEPTPALKHGEALTLALKLDNTDAIYPKLTTVPTDFLEQITGATTPHLPLGEFVNSNLFKLMVLGAVCVALVIPVASPIALLLGGLAIVCLLAVICGESQSFQILQENETNPMVLGPVRDLVRDTTLYGEGLTFVVTTMVPAFMLLQQGGV